MLRCQVKTKKTLGKVERSVFSVRLCGDSEADGIFRLVKSFTALLSLFRSFRHRLLFTSSWQSSRWQPMTSPGQAHCSSTENYSLFLQRWMQNIAMQWKVFRPNEKEKTLLHFGVAQLRRRWGKSRKLFFRFRFLVAQLKSPPSETTSHCICHCDDNCLAGRLAIAIHSRSVSSKALLALAVCLAGCDEVGLESFREISLSQPYSDCPSVESSTSMEKKIHNELSGGMWIKICWKFLLPRRTAMQLASRWRFVKSLKSFLWLAWFLKSLTGKVNKKF